MDGKGIRSVDWGMEQFVSFISKLELISKDLYEASMSFEIKSFEIWSFEIGFERFLVT